MTLEDYVLCPALSRWLPARLGDRVACVTAPGTAMPGALRALCRTWGEAAPPPLSGLVVAGRLDVPVDALPDAALADVRAGGLVADVCVLPRRRIRELFSAPIRAARIREATADRIAAWLARGLFDVEQWVAVDPPDVVITLARRRA